MEKLVLRGIMYGADKIPDTWFEKVPGGYYKARHQSQAEPQYQGRRSDEYDEYRVRRKDSLRSPSSLDKDNRYTEKRSYEDDRYDYDGRSQYDDVKHRRDYRDPDVQRYGDVSPRDQPSPGTAAASGFAAGVAAANMAHDNPAPRSAGEAPYVPYSEIYGSKTSPQTFTPPTSIGSSQSRSMNRASPQRPDYPEDKYRGYDGPYDNSPRERRPQRPRMRSRSYDSYDARDDSRSYQSEAPAEAYRRRRGKSPRGLSTTFDRSQRGLGYGAVGAIAGGIVGSGVGKGKTPAAIGAVLGGLGANMFEARERRKDSSRIAEFARDDNTTARREKRERNSDWKD